MVDLGGSLGLPTLPDYLLCKEKMLRERVVLASFLFSVVDLRLGGRILNESETKLEDRKKRIGKLDSPQSLLNGSRSKGSQEAFRRDPKAGIETPRRLRKERFPEWFCRRAYHEHPYFSDNLRYVR
jgi:hypothetical protein